MMDVYLNYHYYVDQWKLKCHYPGSLQKLFMACLGYCALHSHTDNIAFDASSHSQMSWQKFLRTYSSSYYISLVGDIRSASSETITFIERVKNSFNIMQLLLLKKATRDISPVIAGMSTAQWSNTGTDNLLSVFSQEYPRLYESSIQRRSDAASWEDQRLGRHYSSISVESFPFHNNHYISDLSSGNLKIGTWNYTRRDMSHLSTAFCCHKSWNTIFQALQSLMDALKYDKTLDSSLKQSTSHVPPPHRPDMQTIDFSLPCVDSSLGMSYRFSNLIIGACLITILIHSGSGVDLRQALSMKYNDVNTFVIMTIVSLSGSVCWYCFKYCRLSGMQPQVYFVNGTWMYSCIAESLFLCLRMLAESYDLSSFYVQSGSFVLEAAVKCFLPQPLYRDNPNIIALLFGTTLCYQNFLWDSIVTKLMNYFMIFSLLPKFSWLCIYFLQRLSRYPPKVATTTLSKTTVWIAMIAFLVTWLVYLCRLSLLLIVERPTLSSGGHYFNWSYLLLLALIPCRHMVELSDCLQFVLISMKYHSPKTMQNHNGFKLN